MAVAWQLHASSITVAGRSESGTGTGSLVWQAHDNRWESHNMFTCSDWSGSDRQYLSRQPNNGRRVTFFIKRNLGSFNISNISNKFNFRSVAWYNLSRRFRCPRPLHMEMKSKFEPEWVYFRIFHPLENVDTNRFALLYIFVLSQKLLSFSELNIRVKLEF